MHKLTVVYPPEAGSPEFRDYYVSTHLPLARRLPGLRRLEYAFDLDAVGGGTAPFCLFEAWFDDGVAFGAAMQSAEGQAVAADVPNFTRAAPLIFHGAALER